jgi:hypothetical protein
MVGKDNPYLKTAIVTLAKANSLSKQKMIDDL